MAKSLSERLLAASEVNEHGCLIWQRTQTTCGYGKITVGGKTCRAHRLAYEIFVGEIPDGYHAHHLCVEQGFGSTLCIEPTHLEAVTHIENTQRGNAGKHLRDRTHCPAGHSYQGDNLIVDETGSRRCKTCRTEQARRYRKRRRDGNGDVWRVAA